MNRCGLSSDDQLLRQIHAQKWFYEFELPDGTRTESYLPREVRAIHSTRARALRTFLEAASGDTALDVACHEGYFSLLLADRFQRVVAIDKNAASLEKAALIARAMRTKHIDFHHSSLEELPSDQLFDFTLCFGLLYHVDNPVALIRKLASVTRDAICIETQVLPFEWDGTIEDGSYKWLRPAQGLFGLVVDYSTSPEGGLTDVALVPSLAALTFLLGSVGFGNVRLYEPTDDDYEQFVRRQRVILLASRSPNAPAEQVGSG